ncbi:Flp family type IVb pilin [Kocuria rosea]|uniref:Flp family type IVb pilin n=1 Tax=Kocuria rosea TaxID=1275 RepID=UPI000D645D0A|nr:Flp family type IVb pilin [Kocuria rosea]PWF87556.1 Flp family type IVb pilin [Kocuria rosea]STX02882.1 Flp pilus assembly protein, pilin Flp [Kocuria rosea]
MLPLFITLQTIFGDAKARLTGEERGATAVEYGLLVGLIAVAIIATLVILGPELNQLFTTVTDELDDVTP